MIECPVCKNKFNPNTGRRPKRFCSDPCKVRFWNAAKKVKENNKPENKARIAEERNTVAEHENISVPATVEECVVAPENPNQQRIAELQKELEAIPDKTKGLGKTRAKFLQSEIWKLKTN